jgi:hypothetical protein
LGDDVTGARAPRPFSRRSRRWALAALGAALVAAACNEDLTGGSACPDVCPPQNIQVTDTVLDAVALDTTLAGFPLLGTEPKMLLASRGDTLDVRAVIRFDTLDTIFTRGGVDSSIYALQRAYLLLRIDTLNTHYEPPVRIDLYDVDTTAADTALDAVRALFRQDRLIGGATFDSGQVKDSMRVPLDTAVVLARVKAKKRLRIGFHATSPNGVQIALGSLDGGLGTLLKYAASPDTNVRERIVAPTSATPAEDVLLKRDLVDYQLPFVVPPTDVSAPVMTVGGILGRRAYIAFNVPERIIDSSTVIRATLLLTQRPVRTLPDTGRFNVFPHLVTAGTEVVDLRRAALLISGQGAGFDSLRVAPGDSGAVQVEMVTALRNWARPQMENAHRALVLRSAVEGFSPFEAQYYSVEASAELRPRLRISYSLRTNFGIP